MNIILYQLYNLSRILKPHGFIRKGTVFFRVYGDGILQAVQFLKERAGFNTWVLYIDIQSMYSCLPLTKYASRWSTPRYPVATIKGMRIFPNLHEHSPKQYVDAQLDILGQDGIEWLNAISCQADLIKNVCTLETNEGGIRWNDSAKIAPYLACDDFVSAELIIHAVLAQHRMARKNKGTLTQGFQQEAEPDKKLYELLKLIQEKDTATISLLLKNNYFSNMQHAKKLGIIAK